MAERYLNLPVPLLKSLYIDSETFFNDAFDVGIYLYSKTLEGDEKKRYEDSLKYLGITQQNVLQGIRNAKDVLARLPDKYPITGIDRDMLFNFYKNYKSEFEIACLGAFLGIKSIIGRKPYDKTNKLMIHARMFGYIKPSDLPEVLTSLQIKYKKRYHMDRVLMELQLNWHLKVLWDHNRGFYLSFDLTLEELANVVTKDKTDTRLRQLNRQKRDALNKAKNSNLNKDTNE